MFKIFVAVLAVLPAQVAGVCENTDGKTPKYEYGAKTYSCDRLRFKAGARFNLCQTDEVRTDCQHTCGICCEDSATYKFKLQKSDKEEGCDWILKNKKPEIDVKRAKDYCNGYFSNGASVRSQCQVSCDFCFADVLVTPAPVAVTPAPVSPTPAPVSPTPAPADQDSK